MPVGIKIGVVFKEIEPPGLLNAMFSTIGHCLESDGWGRRFPCLLNHFYQGPLQAHQVDQAIDELVLAKAEFEQLPPTDIIWDIEQLSELPPWGEHAPKRYTNLAKCFVTDGNEDLFDVIEDQFQRAIEENNDVLITFINAF